MHIQSDYACKNPAIYPYDVVTKRNVLLKTFYWHLMWISRAEAFDTMPFLDFTLFACLYFTAQCIFLSMGSFFPAVIVIFYYVSVQMCNKITMQRIGDGDDFRWLAGNI